MLKETEFHVSVVTIPHSTLPGFHTQNVFLVFLFGGSLAHRGSKQIGTGGQMLSFCFSLNFKLYFIHICGIYFNILI